MNPDDAENGSLVEAIGEAIGERFELIATETVSGGCIHTALKVAGNTSGGRKNFFAKINDAEKKTLFETEADGLTAIQAVGAVTSPRVIVQGDDGERAWLVLEWLDLAPPYARSGAPLREALAPQHLVPQDQFGPGRGKFRRSKPQGQR